MLVALATYLSLSWGAYATFGVGVDGDLLETYPRTGLLTGARICVSLLVLSCYPLQVSSRWPESLNAPFVVGLIDARILVGDSPWVF